MSEFLRFEEEVRDAFGGQPVFMVVDGDRSHPFSVYRKSLLVLFEESGHEAAQTGVDVAAEFVFEGQFGDVFDWVDDAVRVVGIRGIQSDSVGVDERFHVFDVDLVIGVEAGFADLYVEEHGSFVDSGVDGLRDNSK